MNRIIHRLLVPLEFPSGLSPGAQRDGNHSILARDGLERPVLRGSAIAGVLRTAWSKTFGAGKPSETARWFGGDRGTAGRHPSRLRVLDALLTGGTADRTHNAINRHTGSVVTGALFSIEAMSPGANADLLIEVDADEATPDAPLFLSQLAGCFEAGLHFGGHGARGIGAARIRGGASAMRHRAFDLSSLDDHGAWLDEQHAWTSRGQLPTSGSPLLPAGSGNTLVVNVTWLVPRGQDFVIGGGESLDHAAEPQRCRTANGRDMLRLPGSAVKGILRSWFNRLAAREGHEIADRERKVSELRGDTTGWAFASHAERDRLRASPQSIQCPVTRLFGSLYAKGRLTVDDALTEAKPDMVTRRAHVAIDRISGGASDGLLFSSAVATAGAGSLSFTSRIRIESPTPDEARWLAMSLQAIHMGILRIGSSKASGRFEVFGTPDASGQLADVFTMEFESIGGSHA
jgi:CRISPR/Cas system CSM-associated protein Csm3 (group 7 of RAMP superfamily)